MDLSAGIDWISCTLPRKKAEERHAEIVPFEGQSQGLKRGKLGYMIAEKYPSGAIRLSTPEDSRMGVHLIYSSQAIAYCVQEYAITDLALLTHLCEFGRVGRLDLRLDATGKRVNIRRLYEEALKGKAVKRSDKVQFVESAETGNERGAATCYIGSMKKRTKLLRVYDKGAQIGATIPHTRFEIEHRGKIATNAANRLKTANNEDYGELVLAIIKDYCHWPQYPTVARIFDDINPVRISVPVHVHGNTVKWLLDTVAPTLAREIALNPIVLSEFMQSVSATLRELGAME